MFQMSGTRGEVIHLNRGVNVAPGVVVRALETEILEERRLVEAPSAFIARHVPPERMKFLLKGFLRPRSGDLVLARIGKTTGIDHLMSRNGTDARLSAGMEVVLVYGRGWGSVYSQCTVPNTLGSTHLIAKCGIAATISGEEHMQHFTRVTPIGLISEDGENPLNISDFCL